MAYDEELAERVRAALDDVSGVNEIKMFGGLCFTIDGNMAVGVSHDDLLVRMSPDDGDVALGEPGVRLMEVGSRTSRGFLSVAPEATKTDRKLHTWVDRGVAFASSLPPKEPTRKEPKKRKEPKPDRPSTGAGEGRG
jgi:TfoX/Sxy family transcriptional regulator of competence genes